MEKPGQEIPKITMKANNTLEEKLKAAFLDFN